MAAARLHLIDWTGSALGALLYRRERFFGRSLDSPPLHEAVPATAAAVSALQPGVAHPVVATGPAGRSDCAYLVHRWHGPSVSTVPRHDRLVELDAQHRAYAGMDLRIIDRRHFTGMAATGALGAHVQRGIDAAMRQRAARGGHRHG